MALQRIDGRLTAEQLRAALNYDHETGIFRWQHRLDVLPRVNKRFVGKEAGCLDGQYGYRTIRLHNALYQAHRLVWLYMTGEWPPFLVDHIDLVPDNNRWANLRLATKSEDMRNTNAPRHNTSGYKGVTFNKASGKWQAQLQHYGKNHHVGLYDTARAAFEARCETAARLHGPFAKSG